MNKLNVLRFDVKSLMLAGGRSASVDCPGCYIVYFSSSYFPQVGSAGGCKSRLYVFPSSKLSEMSRAGWQVVHKMIFQASL